MDRNLFLTKKNLSDVVIALEGLKSDTSTDSPDFIYDCIALACNFTWNIQLISKIMGCSHKEVMVVVAGMKEAKFKKGYLDFLWYPDDATWTEEEAGKKALEKCVEFCCLVMCIKGELEYSTIQYCKAKPYDEKSIVKYGQSVVSKKPIQTKTESLTEEIKSEECSKGGKREVPSIPDLAESLEVNQSLECKHELKNDATRNSMHDFFAQLPEEKPLIKYH